MELKKIYTNEYFGIIVAALYGLIVRISFDESFFNDVSDVFSITFFVVTPIIISLLPIILSEDIRKSAIKSFFFPFLAILLFYLLAVITKLEDTFCLLVLGIPYLLITGTVALLVRYFLKKDRNNNRLYSIILLPLILLPIENSFPDKSENYKVSYSLVIDRPSAEIFPNLLEVPKLSNIHYQDGLYQFIGIPRPIESKSYKNDSTFFRIGKFTDGLLLYETISEMKQNEFVNFKIDLSKSHLRNKPTDNHILKGDFFKFNNISYALTPISIHQTKVELSCEYQLKSKMNFYANFWAQSVIKDFEKRLLNAIKVKLEE